MSSREFRRLIDLVENAAPVEEGALDWIRGKMDNYRARLAKKRKTRDARLTQQAQSMPAPSPEPTAAPDQQPAQDQAAMPDENPPRRRPSRALNSRQQQ